MSQIRDNFIKSLDDSPEGINAKMTKLYAMLKKCDIKVRIETKIKSNNYWFCIIIRVDFANICDNHKICDNSAQRSLDIGYYFNIDGNMTFSLQVVFNPMLKTM